MEPTRSRDLTPAERVQLRRVMREEDGLLGKLDEVLDRRDGLLRRLRWGGPGVPEVMPETLRRATVSERHPDGLGRTTLHRAVGRRRDRPPAAQPDDEQEK